MTVESVLKADLHGTMNTKNAESELKDAESELEAAKSVLKREREAHWSHLVDPKSKKLRRRLQNKINKRVSRFKSSYYLDTLEDYKKLVCKVQDMPDSRPVKSEGRRRRPDDKPKRHTSQRTSRRLADKRRKPDAGNLEEDSLFDSSVDSGFDQLDNAPHSEDGVNISTGTTTNHPSKTSNGDEFPQSLSIEIDRTPDVTLDYLFDSCNSQTLTRDSNIPSLADERWCHSGEINDPASTSTMLHSGSNTSDPWNGSLQQDILDGDSMGFEWQGDFDGLNGSHDLLGIGESLSGSNIILPASHGPLIQPVTSGGIDGGVEVLSSVASLLPEKVDGKHQPKRLNEADLHMLVRVLKSQLHERGKDNIPKKPVLARRSLAERDDLAPLIGQCLVALREPTTYVSENKEDGTGLKESRPAKTYGAEIEMRVRNLWSALRVEARRIPSSAT